jgi:hypothetical protein
MLRAITPTQVEQLVSLLERMSEARKTRAAKGQTQSADEIIHDIQRRELTDHLYALGDEARGELIVLMLVGRGDVDHSFERALETRSKYTSADDQVTYLISKTFRLAEYLRIGLDAVGRSDYPLPGTPE